MTSTPERTSASFALGSFPARPVSSDLWSVTIWDTLATDSFASPVALGGVNIPRRARPLQVTGDRDAHRGRYPTAVQTIALNHHDRSPKPRPCPTRFPQLCPPDLALGDGHHSLRSSVPRAPREANWSCASSISSRARFIVSVTRSGAWRFFENVVGDGHRRFHTRSMTWPSLRSTGWQGGR